MGETCSSCNSATTSDEVKILVQDNKERTITEQPQDENHKKNEMDESKKTEKKK